MNDIRKYFNFGFPRKLSRKAPYYVSSFPKFWDIRLNVIFALMPPSCGYLRPPLTLRRNNLNKELSEVILDLHLRKLAKEIV